MVVCLRPSTGLMLLFSLLALINLSNSLIYEEHLDILHEYFQGGIEQAAKKKAQLMTILELEERNNIKQYEKLYPILGRLIAATKNSESLRDLEDVIKKFLAQKKTKFAKIKKAAEMEIEAIWAVVELQEEAHDEL